MLLIAIDYIGIVLFLIYRLVMCIGCSYIYVLMWKCFID